MPVFKIGLAISQSVRIYVEAENAEIAALIAEDRSNEGEVRDSEVTVAYIEESDDKKYPDVDQKDIDLAELGYEQE